MDILIPIGDYPFFAHACSSNLREYGKNNNILFLVTKNPTQRLIEAIKKAECEYIETPLTGSSHGIHLKLLDWAIQNISLSDWILVQHCDMFWMSSWEPSNLKGVACMLPHQQQKGEFEYIENKFSFNEKALIRTHDFAGFYHVSSLKKYNLKFMWGQLKSIASKNLLEKIDQFQWIKENKKLKENDFIDGSDCISLELNLIDENLVSILTDKAYSFIHNWAVFGFAANMKINKDTIIVDWTLEKSWRGMGTYSWISSFLFDKNIMKDKIFPWSIYNSISHAKSKSNLCCFLEKYKEPVLSLGKFNTGGINQVQFKDQAFKRIII